MMHSYGYYGEHMLFGGFFTLIFWVCVIALIVWVVRGNKSKKGCCGTCCSTKENGALDILKERYAKGEIQKEEFETKKKDLSE